MRCGILEIRDAQSGVVQSNGSTWPDEPIEEENDGGSIVSVLRVAHCLPGLHWRGNEEWVREQ
jgi:hypothetical protein